MKTLDYDEKFEKIHPQTLFGKLPSEEQTLIQKIATKNRFTSSELKKFIDTQIDFKMWNTTPLTQIWLQWDDLDQKFDINQKKLNFKKLQQTVDQLVSGETDYSGPAPALSPAYKVSKAQVVTEWKNDKVWGTCPVYSEKTVCCNLRTIDAVKNCGFGCSYCSIQTMYNHGKIEFDQHFHQKLQNIELDSTRHYHVGTGQSSDALMWGNTHGILDAMMEFAKKWPKVLVEFKSKSKKIKYFLENDIPKNIVLSWSMNPDQFILHEEHLTAKINERLDAARKAADQGIKVSFHFHPLVFFEGWQSHYNELIQKVLHMFLPNEVLFISFGTLTFPKPIIKKIRNYDIQSKILQMPMVCNPEGKMTYPESIKNQLFDFAYQQFKPWHDKVFFYLCMEERKFWLNTFGWCYDNNEQFEMALLESSFSKIK